jgi:hypothetical protein
MMHYIAVNGRTGEAQGSIPIASKRASRSAMRRGLRAAALAIPLVAIGAVLGRYLDAGRPVATAALVVAAAALVYAGVKVATGLRVALRRRAAIVKEQRRPDARLQPESETDHRITRIAREDTAAGPVTRVGGFSVDGRNDATPHRRVSNWYVTVKDAQGPPAANRQPSGTTRESDELAPEGARLPPPSTTVLSVGWRDLGR